MITTDLYVGKIKGKQSCVTKDAMAMEWRMEQRKHRKESKI